MDSHFLRHTVKHLRMYTLFLCHNRETNLELIVLYSVPIQVKVLKIGNLFIFQTYCAKGKAMSPNYLSACW